MYILLPGYWVIEANGRLQFLCGGPSHPPLLVGEEVGGGLQE